MHFNGGVAPPIIGDGAAVVEGGPGGGRATMLDRLFALASDLVCVIDYEARLLLHNPAWTRALGYTEDDLDGIMLTTLMHPDDAIAARSLAGIAFAGGEVASYPVRYRRKDGTYVELEWSLSCVPEEQRIYCVARDISEVRRAEQARSRAESQLSRLLGATSVMLYSCRYGGDYEMLFMSDNVRQVLGYEPDDFLRNPHFWSERLHRDDALGLYTALEALPETGALSYEYRFRRADGRYRWIHDEVRVTRNERGAPVIMEGCWQDVTERKEAQLLIEAQARALMELSTPVVPITDKVLAMPLVGVLDTRRAQMVLDALLQGVSRAGAQVAILDITGVQTVDTQTADALIRAARAVRLLGAEVVLTGIRPEVAQTMVAIGIDFAGITTRSTLQAGIAYATALERRAASPGRSAAAAAPSHR